MEQKNKSTTSSVKDFAFNLLKTQLLIEFLTFILSIGFSIIFPSFWAQLLATVVGLYFFFSFFYSRSWSTGERDRNLVMYGHINQDMLKGLKAGFLSNIPLFVLSLFVVIEAYTDLIPSVYRFFFNMLASPFLFFTTKLYDAGLAFLIPLICLIAPVFSWLGYIHGYNLHEPLLKFIYLSQEQKKRYRSRNGKTPGENKLVTAATVQRPGQNSPSKTTIIGKTASKSSNNDKKLRSR